MPAPERLKQLVQQTRKGDRDAEWELAQKCLAEGDDVRAKHYLKDAAAEGHLKSQLAVAHMYSAGHLWKRDYKEAMVSAAACAVAARCYCSSCSSSCRLANGRGQVVVLLLVGRSANG